MSTNARSVCGALFVSNTRKAGRWILLPLTALSASPLVFAAPPPNGGLPITAQLTPTDEQQLVPDALAASEIGLVAAQSQFQNIKARLAALRSSRNEDRQALAQRPGSASSGLGKSTGASYAADEQTETGAEFSRLGFFASATFERGRSSAGDVSPGTRFDLHGFTAGLDYRRTETWVLGGAFGLNDTSVRLTQSQGRVEGDTWNVSGYSSWANKNDWYVDAVLTYGHTSYDMRRTVGAQTFTGHPDGRTLSFAGTVGRDFANGGWNVGPFGRLLYTDLSLDAFTERVTGVGPGTAQHIKTHDQTAFSAVLGAKATYAHSTANGVWLPHFEAEWQHDFSNDAATVEASLAGVPGTPLVFVGDELDGNYFRLGVGGSYISTRGRSGFIYYERVLGRERYSDHSLAIGVRIEF